MGVSAAAITSGTGLKSNGIGGFDPFAGSQREAVQTSLISKGLEFETFKTQAGLNSFYLTPKKWIDATQAIGIQSRAGRYGGGTYAHEL